MDQELALFEEESFILTAVEAETDAIRMIMGDAFSELNLFRLTLNVLEYNSRPVRCYEKLGFTIEGRQRQCCLRAGRRRDLINMGILRSDRENS